MSHFCSKQVVASSKERQNGHLPSVVCKKYGFEDIELTDVGIQWN